MRSASAVSREVQGTLVVLDVRGGQYFSLDEVGARVWALCDGHHELAEIASLLAADYDAEPETIARDVRELLDQLRAEFLVVSPGRTAEHAGAG